MTAIRRIELFNWGPFRGRHSIEVPMGPIAIVGRRDGDRQSSNWIGKTWLLSAIRYALTGRKPRTAKSEDSWITEGQREGGVVIELTDGVTIERMRKLGTSTKFKLDGLGHGAAGSGGQAKDELTRYLGFDADDFDESYWVGQKQADRIVLEGPTDRATTVEAWVGVDRLREAEALATARSSKAFAEAAQLDAQANALAAAMPAETVFNETAIGLELYSNDVEIKRIDQDFSPRAVQLAQREYQRVAKVVEEYDALCVEGPALKAELAALDQKALERALEDAQSWRDEALTEESTALAALEERRRLVAGGFDGQCPVMCETCPVSKTVKLKLERNSQALEDAEAMAAKARDAYSIAEREFQKADRAVDEAALKAERLRTVRERAKKLEDEALAFDGMVEPNSSVVDLMQEKRDRLTERSNQLRTLLATAQSAQKLRAEQAKRVDGLKEQAAQKRSQAQHWATVAKVLWTTRREVAEATAKGIESTANRALAASGVDLTVAFQWQREGDGLASNCDKCGAGYPTKRSVTTCAACGARRPAKLIEQLDLVMSDRSGAADDLAGLWLQLAAASWLREYRGIDFGAVLVDEPFAALDRPNARALGSRLHSALDEFGFDQAFIVAHHSAVTDSLPARIVVCSNGRASRLEVEI